MWKLIRHVRVWDAWRKDSESSKWHKLWTLLGVAYEPMLELVILPEEWKELQCLRRK